MVAKYNKLTGGARAASSIELTPFSGDCKIPRSFKTANASWERHCGKSLIMLVFTAPGSATLQKEEKKETRQQVVISIMDNHAFVTHLTSW